MDIREALKQAMGKLRIAGVPSHTLAAEVLLMHTLERDRAWIYAHPEEALDAATHKKYFDLITRRSEGTPTQYLTGKQEFWGLEFEVTPAVLIPRPETEHVVEVALARIGQQRGIRPLRIADVGTGSGCLALALACELPDAEIVATDTSPAALEVARRNAMRHGVLDRVTLVECHLLDDFLTSWPDSTSARFDLIVSNPPYVARREKPGLQREVREHEPESALFGGEEGDEFYAPLVDQSAKLLDRGGILVLELGYDSLGTVGMLLEAVAGWIHVSVTEDLAGVPRVIAAERS